MKLLHSLFFNIFSFSRVPTYDVDGYFNNRMQKVQRPLDRNLSNVSSPCSSQSSRPGLYVGNPSYASTTLQESEQEQESVVCLWNENF